MRQVKMSARLTTILDNVVGDRWCEEMSDSPNKQRLTKLLMLERSLKHAVRLAVRLEAFK